MRFFHFRRSIFAALALIFFSALAAPARDLTFTPQNCRITIPDDWKVIPAPGTVLTSLSVNNEGLILAVSPGSAILDLDNEAIFHAFTANFAKGSDLTISGTSSAVLNGVHFRVIHGVKSNGYVNMNAYVCQSGGQLYIIMAICPGADPDGDPVLQKALGSFAFLGAPQAQPSLARRIVALVILLALILMVGGALLGAALFVKRKFFRRPLRTKID